MELSFWLLLVLRPGGALAPRCVVGTHLYQGLASPIPAEKHLPYWD